MFLKIFDVVWIIIFTMLLVVNIQDGDVIPIIVDSLIIVMNVAMLLNRKDTK